MNVALPADLAERIPRLFGDRGTEWVTALPGLVGSLCRRWDLTVVGPAFSGGTHSYVAPVRRAGRNGPDLVLKVPVRDDENYAEAAALRCYAGDGAVRLHEVDLDSGGLLLEAADARRSLLAEYEGGRLPMEEVVGIAAGLLGALSRPPSGDLSCPA
ncbi:MAG: aminoglycoside phosphotransferase family protein, partial [Actinocatenispora sp.]